MLLLRQCTIFIALFWNKFKIAKGSFLKKVLHMIITEGLVILIRKSKSCFFLFMLHRNTVHLIVNKTLMTKHIFSSDFVQEH